MHWKLWKRRRKSVVPPVAEPPTEHKPDLNRLERSHQRTHELWRQRSRLTAGEIIDKLCEIHGECGLAFCAELDGRNFMYDIICKLERRPDLTPTLAARLAQLLTWNETLVYCDNSVRLGILSILSRLPSQEIRSIVSKHREYITKASESVAKYGNRQFMSVGEDTAIPVSLGLDYSALAQELARCDDVLTIIDALPE